MSQEDRFHLRMHVEAMIPGEHCIGNVVASFPIVTAKPSSVKSNTVVSEDV